MEKSFSVDVEALLQNSANSALSQKDRKKRALSSTGSSAGKPPRAKSRMAPNPAADDDRSGQSQGDIIGSSVLTDEEQRAQQERREIADGSSGSDARKTGAA